MHRKSLMIYVTKKESVEEVIAEIFRRSENKK
jgi:hypothetical protein